VSLVLGIDSSTTATKAVLVDHDGAVLGVGVRSYGFETPHPGWAEQHPHLWWEGTVGAIAEALAVAGVDGSAVEAVGLTGQMHGLVMLDARGVVIRPALLWNDQRTADQCDAIRDAIGFERLVALTGNDAMTGFTAPKVAWVRDHEPDHHAAIASVMLPKDYVRYRLTGAVATDVADGSGTLLMDVANRQWAPEMLELVGLDASQVPELFEGPEVTGVVHETAAGATGLRAGIPVVGGGGDQAANAVGVGAVSGDVGALSMGTSGVVFVASDTPVTEPRGRVHAFCHAVPNRWHTMGVMLSAAGSLRWYRDTLAPGTSFEALTEEASTVPAGAEGLRFLPYLTGERTPHPDPEAKGAFIGLTVRHERAHLTRAVLEGVAFGLADGLDLMRAAGIATPGTFHASGGGTRSGLWLQIVADVLDADIATVRTVEGAAFGAALLAGVGASWWPSVDDATSVVQRVATTTPGPDAPVHRAAHAGYRELYPALADRFPALGP
jgi:xylulokinase